MGQAMRNARGVLRQAKETGRRKYATAKSLGLRVGDRAPIKGASSGASIWDVLEGIAEYIVDNFIDLVGEIDILDSDGEYMDEVWRMARRADNEASLVVYVSVGTGPNRFDNPLSAVHIQPSKILSKADFKHLNTFEDRKEQDQALVDLAAEVELRLINLFEMYASDGIPNMYSYAPGALGYSQSINDLYLKGVYEVTGALSSAAAFRRQAYHNFELRKCSYE